MLLKRVDGDENTEVKFSNGKIEIGRGPLLKCADKRVSRRHAILEVSDSERVIVTAIHANPCFYQKKGETGLKVLNKDQSVELTVGDQLQLLPTIYSYELMSDDTREAATNGHDATQGESKAKEEEENGILKKDEDDTQKLDEAFEEEKPEEERVIEESPVEPANGATVKDDVLVPDRNNDEEQKTTNEHEHKKDRKIPAWMLHKDTTQTHSSPEKRVVAKRKERSVSKSPPKSPSEVSPAPKKGLADKVDQPQEVKSEGARAIRPACQYGSSCYRRNPAHKEDFSHPGDDDYLEPRAPEPDMPDENDPRPECEYGLTCYRKNPRHREAFKHTQAPRPKRTAKKRGETKRREEDYEEEDDYDLKDPFIDDDNDTSDYIPSDDDEDDDWNVKEDDDSEVVDLLKEARDFMRNKKMQEPA